MKFITLMTVLSVAGSVWAGAEEAASLGKFNYDFNSLPKSGSIPSTTRGWSGHFWPFKQGSINNRWNAPGRPGFNYKKATRQEILRMSSDQLSRLSPSEKWDIYNGDYTNYSTFMEAWQYNSPDASAWAGICHGWAPASLHHKEPTPKTLVNKDGVRVPFGSGDIKALISYFYADQQELSSQLGKKCRMGNAYFPMPGCRGDVNPAALHVVMTNLLGIQHKGFLMDRDPYKEIWNQPVTGFKVVDMTRPYKSGSGFKVDVHTELYWTDEALPTWNTVFGTALQKTQTMFLSYTLKLDKKMKIVDGSWNSDTAYPDFVWTTPKLDHFTGMWAGLEQLLND